jgi:hypothetical protein
MSSEEKNVWINEATGELDDSVLDDVSGGILAGAAGAAGAARALGLARSNSKNVKSGKAGLAGAAGTGGSSKGGLTKKGL